MPELSRSLGMIIVMYFKDHRKIVRELFETIKVNLNTLCWDNVVDFAPEYLYEQIEFPKEKIA